MTLHDIGYETVSLVLESWDSARRVNKGKTFEVEFGKLLVQKYVQFENVLMNGWDGLIDAHG